jgi:hypothetical protein
MIRYQNHINEIIKNVNEIDALVLLMELNKNENEIDEKFAHVKLFLQKHNVLLNFEDVVFQKSNLEAEKYRQLGNELFRDKDFDGALDCYNER